MPSHELLDPRFLTVLAIILIAVGAALAFAGRKIWGRLLSLLGAMIGGTVGYVVGYILGQGDVVLPLLLGFVGSIVGSMVFAYLTKAALAFLCGLLALGIVVVALGSAPESSRITAGIIALVIAFALAYYFVDELLGVLTALVGGLVLGAGVFLLTASPAIGLLLGGLVFVTGALVQQYVLQKPRRRPAYAPMAPPPAAPPPATPPPS